MVELVVRLVFSLAVVIGMVMVLAKLSAKRFRGSGEALVRVVHRQPLSRGSSVAVVTVGSRVLVLGTTEQQVQLLAELDPEELDIDLEDDLDQGTAEPSPTPSMPAPVLLGVPVSRRTPVASVRRAARTSARDRARVAGRHARTADSALLSSALAGSVLSAQTWKQAFAAATGKVQDAS